MADLTVPTADFNSGIRPTRGEDWITEQLGSFTPFQALLSGQLVRIRTDNKIEKASAAALGTADVCGFVYKPSGGPGAPSVHLRGALSGYAGMATGGPLFLSDTAGAISTTAGTIPIPIGFSYFKNGLLVVFLDLSPAAIQTAILLATP